MKVTLMPKRLKDVWDDWGIELLVTVSCGMHVVLTLFGSRRKSMKSHQVIVRFIIWSAYLLLDYVVNVTVGKLTLIPISDYTQENTDSELRGILAPLLLMQLGSRDSITAYSIEDDRLGLRKVLNLLANLMSVLWILLRCWTYTKISYMYFPLLLAGLIKYGENVWALSTALSESSGITISEFYQEDNIAKIFKDLPCSTIPDLKLILKSYYRFLCLKPHIDNWIYRPLYQLSLRHESQSIDDYSPQDIFKITDFELGFVYDVLYTKAPIVYTRTGLVLRLISSLSLISTSIVFVFLFKDAFVYYINAGFTFVVLGVIITLEAYQICALFFSDWAIIEMSKHRDKPTVEWFLRKLAPQSMKWKRWSNTLSQFNLISYCLGSQYLHSCRILKFHGFDMEMRNVFCTYNVRIPAELKELIIREIEDLENEESNPIGNNNGEWKVNRNAITIRFSESDLLKWTEKDREFDQRIIIWHLATEILYHQAIHQTDYFSNTEMEMGRLLSNYMMYLLATRSHILCITTSNIVFQHACKTLVAFMKSNSNRSTIRDEQTACRELLAGNYEKESELDKSKETMVTKKWDVLGDAEKLSQGLLKRDDRWKLICSMWVKMLCFAATNCPTDCHSEQLRRGGEIVTHVWLILLHKKQAHTNGSVSDQSGEDSVVI